MSGVVAALFKRGGDAVAVGEPLLAIADEDCRLAVAETKAQLARARAAVAEADAGLQKVRSEHQRAVQLRRRRILSPNEFDKSEAALHMAEAAVEAARAERKLAEVRVARAEKALRDTVVRAPFAGHVVRRLVDEGTVIRTMPPTTAMVVAETDPVKIEGGVGEYDAAAVKIGLPVEALVDAFPGRSWHGEVEMVHAVLDPVTRAAKVRVMLPNPEGELKPGMAATLVIDLGAVRGVAVPPDVFTDLGDGTGSLFVVGADQHAVRREVQIRKRTDEWVIVAVGLTQEDRAIGAGPALGQAGPLVGVCGALC